MRKIFNILLISTTAFLASCAAKSDNDHKDQLSQKKTQLETLKKQQAKLTDQINTLQAEILKLDPSLAKQEKAKLVAVTAVTPGSFAHYIELQGKVEANNIAYVTPRNGVGGQVKAVYVQQGEYVNKGQTLLKLDDAIIRQQIEQAQTQLAYAKDLYQRRSNLWKENIGTEVELNTAKNNVDQAQKQLDILKEQLGFTNVIADISGVADEVTIRVGELFTGNPAAGHIRIVNTSNLKITTNVPEIYIGQVKTGTPAIITLPDINKTLDAKISITGKVIDPNSRSFYAEARLPESKEFKPNQIALVKIEDYSAPKAITVPVNTVQTDESGKFVMVAANENGKLVARKRQVTAGMMYSDKMEIKDGLQAGDQVITEGFQGLYDGQFITTSI